MFYADYPSARNSGQRRRLLFFAQVAAADMTLRSDVTYRDATNTQFNLASPFNVTLDEDVLVNLRASVDWNDWTASLFGKNLTDERAQVDAIAATQDPLARITVRPRTVGVSLTRRF